MTEKLSLAFKNMKGFPKQRQEGCTVERRKQGSCSGTHMTFTLLPKREKEDVRMSRSVRAAEQRKQMLQLWNTAGDALSVFAQNAL